MSRRDDQMLPRNGAAADLPELLRSRRSFLMIGFGVLLSGCASTQVADSLVPPPAWDAQPLPPVPRPDPDPIRAAAPADPAPLGRAIARRSWTRARPVPRLMNRMTTVRYITVHHDGMQPFYGTSQSTVAARLELIRRGHRGRKWGDIGYHFAVDRAGRVWECRPLAWQGAHVKNHNPGNIGVVALGNFDEQQPSEAQVDAVRRQVSLLMNTYGVPVRRVKTHQEWARTACPGRSMQGYMSVARSNGWLA
ncbi:MAG: peptidoglycan recognition protein family protein [Planctomycetota bacterium]|jgi:hypothetical protein